MRATVSHPRTTASGLRLAASFIDGVCSRGLNASIEGAERGPRVGARARRMSAPRSRDALNVSAAAIHDMRSE
jgi:hypothetical protein